jgi:alpha-tubulin suppressor-like RCC1 family protein
MTSTSIVLKSGNENNGIISKVKSLFGLKVANVFGVQDKLYAATLTDTYNIVSGEREIIQKCLIISGGKGHSMALSSEGILYSWGKGHNGELGQGNRISETNMPNAILRDCRISHVSCGHYHSCAIDSDGNLYAWGQNFDRQLGLYRKGRDKLPTHAMVEDLTMTPRYIPFSIQNPVQSVSCGSKFTAVVTKV